MQVCAFTSFHRASTTNIKTFPDIQDFIGVFHKDGSSSRSAYHKLVRLRQPVSSEALLAVWDPASNSLTDLTAAAPAVFQQGLGVMARSGDHSKVIVAANDASGELALFDAAGNVIAGPPSLGAGAFSWVAANNSGSQFAFVFSGA